jgi:replicative DNA helicase
MSGRYSKDGQANLGVFLKGHAGDLLLVDRKGREPERIDKPALTIVVTIQPQVLLDIARRPVLRGRGLLARILYSFPPDTVGYRRIDVDPVPSEIAETYHRNMKALALSLAEWTDPAVLVLTPEARKLLAEYQEEIEPRLRAIGGDLAEIRDWASKQAGATVRIAGLLHLAGDLAKGWGRPVDADAMTNAIELGQYFTSHARAAFARMGSDPLIDDALAVLAWIERTDPARFTRRDAHMGLSRARFPKVTDLDPALALLVDHGYLRRADTGQERAGRGRPPSPAYEVHPSPCHGNHGNHGIHGSAP